LLAWLIASPLAAQAAISPQASIPPGWQVFTNPILKYTIAYPPTWRFAGGDPRVVQEFTSYDQETQNTGYDIPLTGSDAKVEVYQFRNRPASL
jgi:hypothetical protein